MNVILQFQVIQFWPYFNLYCLWLFCFSSNCNKQQFSLTRPKREIFCFLHCGPQLHQELYFSLNTYLLIFGAKPSILNLWYYRFHRTAWEFILLWRTTLLDPCYQSLGMHCVPVVKTNKTRQRLDGGSKKL